MYGIFITYESLRYTDTNSWKQYHYNTLLMLYHRQEWLERERQCVCVCVCVIGTQFSREKNNYNKYFTAFSINARMVTPTVNHRSLKSAVTCYNGKYDASRCCDVKSIHRADVTYALFIVGVEIDKLSTFFPEVWGISYRLTNSFCILHLQMERQTKCFDLDVFYILYICKF